MQHLSSNSTYTHVGRNMQIDAGFGGMKPVAQSGTVAITSDGVVALFDGKDNLIDQAPIGSVKTKNIPLVGAQTVFLFLGEKRYSVSINAIAGQIISGDLYPGALGAFKTRQSTTEFLSALETARAN